MVGPGFLCEDRIVDTDIVESLAYMDNLINSLGIEQYDQYIAALAEVRERQDREIYELRIQHCHERLQLLHRFNAEHVGAAFWQGHMFRITRKFQSRRKARNISTVNL